MQSITIYIIDKHGPVMKALQTRLQLESSFNILYSGVYEPNLAAQAGVADVALVGLTSGSRVNYQETEQVVYELTAWGTAVIVLTPYIRDIEREMALHAGAYRYLLKTINTNRLIEEITAVYQEKLALDDGNGP